MLEKMIGFLVHGAIMLMLYYTECQKKKLYNQIINGKSMYVSCNKKKIFCSSIAGGVIPIALGVALSIKKKGKRIKYGYLLET